MTRPVGYVVSGYPGVSHTFIMREVQALRSAGVSVHTYSVRAAATSDILSADDVVEAERTTALLPVSPLRLAHVVLSSWARHPSAHSAALFRALRRGKGSRGRLWQVFYFFEAVLLRRYCVRDGVSHLHAHFANNAADIARTTADLGQRVDGPGTWSWSFTMHGPTEFDDPVRFGLAAKVVDAAFVACISHYCQDRIAGLVAPQLPDSVLVRCGLDLRKFPLIDRAGRTTPLRVLCVGRLVAEKGQTNLVAAIDELVREGIALEVTLVGDGPCRTEIEAEVQRRQLAGVVTLTGAVGQDEILGWYEWADVFALLSYAEGLPVVLMEAMATGLPVVTTHVAGIPELVEHGVTGSVLAPGDVPAAACALRRLAADRDGAVSEGTRARHRVVMQHDITTCVSPLAATFDRFMTL